MSSKYNLQLSNELSSSYDEYMEARSWVGPDLVFNKLSQFIQKDNILLDIGIGTGLCSFPFYQAGMKIYGLDGAEGMVKVCEEKKITQEIVLFDLTKNTTFPFVEIAFNLVLAHAVFQLVGDVGHVFKEVYKRLVPGGIFAFTTMDIKDAVEKFSETDVKGLFLREQKESRMKAFAHSNAYIDNLLHKNNFTCLDKVGYTGFKDNIEGREVKFILHIVKKS